MLVEQFIASFRRTPKRLVLDFDATDDAVHGPQEGPSSTAATIVTASCVLTELARAYVGTIRLKLLRVGAVMVHNTRRVRFLMSSSYRRRPLLFPAATRLRRT